MDTKHETGLKYDNNKPRWDLIPVNEMEEIVNVLTNGAIKYKDENWKLVRPFFNRYFAATMRHLKARKEGKIYDEDGQSHLAHAATNILFLMYGDNKKIDLHEKNIALDIDEVLADYADHHLKHYNKKNAKVCRDSYGLYFGYYEDFESSLDDKDFWMSIPVLTKPSEIWFEPKCYITHRRIPKEWTEDWLADNGFPIRPVIYSGEKGQACLDNNVDIMIDDVFTNFIDITNHGVKCLLFDRPHNQKFNVGNLRIKTFKEII